MGDPLSLEEIKERLLSCVDGNRFLIGRENYRAIAEQAFGELQTPHFPTLEDPQERLSADERVLLVQSRDRRFFCVWWKAQHTNTAGCYLDLTMCLVSHWQFSRASREAFQKLILPNR